MAASTITLPRLMTIGANAHKEVSTTLEKLGVKRPLLVSDAFIQQSGILDKITKVLDSSGITWSAFTDTVPDPTTAAVANGVSALINGHFDC